MKTSPFISVIIPCFNSEEFLAETLNSLLNQSYQLFEAIIVNDGSTDNTSKILKKYSSHENFKVINQSNKGLSVSRNIAIKHSKGKVLTFLDSDDLFHEDYLLKVSKFHSDHPDTRAAAFSRVMYINEESSLLYMHSFGYPYKLTLDKFIDCPLLPVAVSIKKSALERFGAFNPETKIAEDYELWTKLSKNGVEFHPCPDNLVFYRYRKSGMMYNKMEAYNNKFSDLQKSVLNCLEDVSSTLSNRILLKRKLTAWILAQVNQKSKSDKLDCALLSDDEIAEVLVNTFTRAFLKPWEKWVEETGIWHPIVNKISVKEEQQKSNIIKKVNSQYLPLPKNSQSKIKKQLKPVLKEEAKVGIFGAGRSALKILPGLKGLENKIIFVDDCPIQKIGNFKVQNLTDCKDIRSIFLSSTNYVKTIEKRIKNLRPDLTVRKFTL